MTITSAEIRDICAERLGRWTDRLVEQHSTPLVLLGVGHDGKSGQLTICTPEEITDTDAMVFLEGALKIFRKNQAGQGGHR